MTPPFRSPAYEARMTLPPLPPAGESPGTILDALAELRSEDLDYTRATSYHFESGDDAVREVAIAAAATAWGRNGLDPTAFPSVAAVENDLVAAALELHGDLPGAVGTVTSGGTESCMLAVLQAREAYRADGGEGRPQMLLPVTAHPAFRKGAWLFDVDVVDIGLDDHFRVDERQMIDSLSDRTALVVVSAPSYAHGVIDPVASIAAAAQARGVRCHLDMCIGGWVLPFIRQEEGEPPIDLTVPGVTSVSMDLHKYGYAPKGASVLLNRTAHDRGLQYFADAAWPGYPLVNNTLASSRSVAPAASAWAVLHLLGRQGLREAALKARRGALRIAHEVEQMPGLRLVAPPESTLVCIADTGDPNGPDVRIVADEAKALGWSLQVQPPRGSSPANLHITVSAGIADRVDELLAVLAEATVRARGQARVDPDPSLVQAAATVDVEALDDDTTAALLAMAGLGAGGGALPERMAGVNALLGALPVPLVEKLLKAVFSQVFTAPGSSPDEAR